MGHNLFTDMESKLIINYAERKFVDFLQRLFNIIEDVVIEILIHIFIKKNYKYDTPPKKYFDFIIERLFIPKAKEYKDDGSVDSFMNYLLLFLRVGKENINSNNIIWDKYEKDLIPQLKEVLLEPNATRRIEKTIKLGEWMIENIKEFNWEDVCPPEDPITGRSPRRGKKPSPVPLDGLPMGKTIKKILDKMLPTKSSEKSSEKSGSPSSVSEEKDSDEKEDKSLEDSKDGEILPEESDEESEKDPSEETGGEPEEDEDDEDDEGDDPTVDDSPDFEDFEADLTDVFEGGIHEWIFAKDECDFQDDVIEEINEQISENSSIINQISKFLKTIKDRVKPIHVGGFSSGKFNIRDAIRENMKGGAGINVFDQVYARGKTQDLAISLLCDNSGSMCGVKSEICSRATVALAEACERAHIPFECNAFTKTADTDYGTCVTIVLKDFKDSFEKAKPYFAINDSSLVYKITSERDLYTFSGNSEEVNLYYVWKKIRSNPHKKKIIIVLCDGATTGDRDKLRQVVKQINDDKIQIIAIGICDSGVAGIYPESKIFSSLKDLEGLGSYLCEILLKNIKGGQ